MLLESELEAITSQAGMMNKTFNLHYESGKPGALKAAVETLCREVEEAVKNGCEVCVQLPLGFSFHLSSVIEQPWGAVFCTRTIRCCFIRQCSLN